MKCPAQFIAKPEVTCYFEFPPSQDYQDVRRQLRRYVSLLDDYYSEKGIANPVGFQTYSLPREFIKNAYHHGGGKNHTVEFGIFLVPESTVVGCMDGGDYFTRPEIKQIWEEKIPVRSRVPQTSAESEFGFNCGNGMIYSLTDAIYVDNGTGTIFGQFDPRIYLLSSGEIEEIFRKREPFGR